MVDKDRLFVYHNQPAPTVVVAESLAMADDIAKQIGINPLKTAVSLGIKAKLTFPHLDTVKNIYPRVQDKVTKVCFTDCSQSPETVIENSGFTETVDCDTESELESFKHSKQRDPSAKVTLYYSADKELPSCALFKR